MPFSSHTQAYPTLFFIFHFYPYIDISFHVRIIPAVPACGHALTSFHRLVLRYGFIAFAALLYATFLGPAFYYLWIYAGSGNANFFYAITLVWSLGLTIVVADSIYAVLRDEFDVDRPEMKGKEVVRI